jgi:shikimate kinase
MQQLFIIGMSGCGKTYWAKQLAGDLGWKHFDTDAMIITKTGKSIASIFDEEGESFFRKIESTVLRELIENNENFVCSTGGGLPLDLDNFSLMKQNGTTIYLQASIPFLFSNISKDYEQRPLLKGDNIEQQLLQLFNERKSVYEQADFTFNAEQLTLSQFQTIIQR